MHNGTDDQPETDTSIGGSTSKHVTYQRLIFTPFPEVDWFSNKPSIVSKASIRIFLSFCRSSRGTVGSLILFSIEASTLPKPFRTRSKPSVTLQSLRKKQAKAPCTKWRYAWCGGFSFQENDAVCNPTLICSAEKLSRNFLARSESG